MLAWSRRARGRCTDSMQCNREVSVRQHPMWSILAVIVGLAAVAGAGDVQIDGTYVSTAASGTAPLAVASDTRVPNLNADLLDGLDATAFALADHEHAGVPSLVRTVVVSPVPGDIAASGAALTAALAAIAGAAADNPWLIQLEPGEYFVAGTLQMKPYVSIAGAGAAITHIYGVPSSRTGVVALAQGAELRDLEVSAFASTAISCGVAGATLNDVRVTTYSLTEESIGLYAGPGCEVRTHHVEVAIDTETSPAYGVYVDSSSPELSDLQVSVTTAGANAYGITAVGGSHPTLRSSLVEVSSSTSFAIFVDGDASITLRGVEAHGTGSTWGFGLSVTTGSSARTIEVTDSRLAADNYAVSANDANLTLRFGGSELDGALVGTGTTTYQCVSCWDGAFSALRPSCL